jgi:hypothetical protein
MGKLTALFCLHKNKNNRFDYSNLHAFLQSSVADWDTIWRYKSTLTQVIWVDTNFGRAHAKVAELSMCE